MRTTSKIAIGCLGTLMVAGSLRAQESLAGLGAASGIGATLGAAAAGGVSAGRATRNVGRASAEMMDETEGGGARRGPNGAPGGEGATGAAQAGVAVPPRLNWGTGNGSQIINQLTATRSKPRPLRATRSPRGQSRYSTRVTRQTPTQRTRVVQQKYKVPPRGWLAHYLPEDRYKITSGIWKVVSTETDRFYYRADAPAMLRQSPRRVIGFASWQDAMIAGYRPDPVTKPEPGAQFAYLAGITRGPQLTRYVEYAYSGQVTPASFNSTYNYIRQVVRTVNKYPYARPLLPQTIETIIEASLTGNPDLIPRTIGGTPVYQVQVSPAEISGANPDGEGVPPMPGGAPPTEVAGQADRREEEFNSFRNNAGRMANVPANN